jgi:hypothetical protein
MANAAQEVIEKIKTTGGIMKDVIFTTKDKALEIVTDTRDEVFDAVDKTGAAAKAIGNSGQSLVQGIKNFGGIFKKANPSEDLIRAVPEAGLPKGHPDFETGKIQQGGRQNNQGTNRMNLDSVFFVVKLEDGKYSYLSIPNWLSYQRKIEAGELSKTNFPVEATSTNPKTADSSSILLPFDEIEPVVNEEVTKVDHFVILSSPGQKATLSISEALARYEHYDPEAAAKPIAFNNVIAKINAAEEKIRELQEEVQKGGHKGRRLSRRHRKGRSGSKRRRGTSRPRR